MRILRAADYRVMPWKNGAGSTTEIAISPANATLDGFDWRVSMAQVSTDGPFSLFDNIDRTLLVLQGDGIDLSVTGHNPARVDARAIHAFPGDRPASATLINGPVTEAAQAIATTAFSGAGGDIAHRRKRRDRGALTFGQRDPRRL